MRICLVRHGQTDWNKKLLIQGHTDNPLNEIGIEQAKLSAKYLMNNLSKWDIVITSPLQRAKHTGEIIHQALKLENEILINEAFIERDFGQADGKKIAIWWPKVKNGEISNCETDEAIQSRTMNEINNLLKDYKGKNVLITAHSQSIKAILSSIAPEKISFSTKLKNACLNIIEHKDDQWSIVEFNVSDHITE
ncbi:histidine phosphatase family protein [Mycoplasmatota bacterium WC44]